MDTNTYAAFSASFHDVFTRDPNDCVALGVSKRLGELPDPSTVASESEAAECRSLLSRAAAVRASLQASGDLDFDRALDLDLAELALSAQLHKLTYTFNGRTMRQQMPTAGDDITEGIFAMFVSDPRPDGERLADITARIAQVPAYLEALSARLDTPVARWVAIDLDKVAEMPGFFANLQNWADDVGFADRAALQAARERAEAALTSYSERLRQMPTTTQLHVGDECTRELVALRGIELSLSELHQLARDFLAQEQEQIEDLRGRLVSKYHKSDGDDLAPDASAAELHRYLNRRYRVSLPANRLEDILERYQDERSKILDFIGEHALFPVPTDQDMKLLRTPAFMAPTIPAGAMQPPAPFREGVRTSLVYLTLSEALIDEHTELSIPNMMIHEGIPGHHLQLASAAAHPSLIRRHFNACDQAEGWTTMLEDYLLDLGYMGELTDEARFVGKRDLARIGARVAIDLYFMTGERDYLDVGVDCDIQAEDPFVAAGNLLAAVTGFVPPRVQAELNWYSQQRGYPLSYLAGNHLVWQLKRDVAAAQAGRAAGEALSGLELDRAFHQVYLESGNMPVSFLRRVYQHRGLLS